MSHHLQAIRHILPEQRPFGPVSRRANRVDIHLGSQSIPETDRRDAFSSSAIETINEFGEK